MFFLPDNEKINYMGRIEFSDPKAPVFYFAGSQILFDFSGTSLKIKLNNHTVWGEVSLGAIIDGEMIKVQLQAENNDKDMTLTVAENLAAGKHTAVIYKKHAGNQFFAFKGIEADELLEKPELPSFKVEAYGDSVCAGEVIEAADYVGKCDPEGHNSRYDNVWNSFVMQTARDLGGQIHNICQGGIALFNGTGYFHSPDYIGLETTYDKLCYFPEGGELTPWDFKRYIPDLVIIAIGQNDKHNGITDSDDIDIADPAYREKWKTAYKKFVFDLNEKYGSPKFVLTTTVLMHDAEWDKAIDEIKDELNAAGVKAYHNLFTRNGAATPGHPRLAEHNEMAEELTAFIRKNVL